MKGPWFILEAGILLTSLAPCCADPTPVIHYAPAENLEHVDVDLVEPPRNRLCGLGRAASWEANQ
jgi:hypothetical protein